MEQPQPQRLAEQTQSHGGYSPQRKHSNSRWQTLESVLLQVPLYKHKPWWAAVL
jgi:hypothetical protein